MSQNLNNPAMPRPDYGAISSSSSNLPDVSFSGFSPTEFMSLSEDIATNISAVKDSLRQLERILKIIGTPRDQQSTRDKVHTIHARTNTQIETTSKFLQRLSSVVRRGDKQQKLQLEKLTTDFRSVVEKYCAVQQRITAAIKETYILAIQQDEESATAANSSTAPLLQQQQQQQQSQLQFEQDMLIEREQQMAKIHADLLDVNAIMRTVSNILQAQGENVDRIETSIDNTAADVETGREELAKASASRSGYRKKMLILLLIAVIIGVIVSSILLSKLKG